MKGFLLSFLLLLLVIPVHAGIQAPRKGCVSGGGGGCTTVLATVADNVENQNLFGTYYLGDSISVSSGAVICGVNVWVVSVEEGGPETLEVRVGTSDNLTTTYVSGTLAVTSANNGTKVTIPLSSTITGSTTYYFAVFNSTNGDGYNDRVVLRGNNANTVWRGVTWDLASANDASIDYEVLGQ